jgi:hypothetical protein
MSGSGSGCNLKLKLRSAHFMFLQSDFRMIIKDVHNASRWLINVINLSVGDWWEKSATLTMSVYVSAKSGVEELEKFKERRMKVFNGRSSANPHFAASDG